MNPKELELALSKAKIKLMQKPDSVFFTTVCFSLKFKWDKTIPTAATNGTALLINPEFFLSLSTEQRVSMLVHESMHVAYMHNDPARVGNKDKHRWNIAADHVVNLQLQGAGFQLPTEHSYADPTYKGMSVEEVYKLLPEDCGESTGDILPLEGDPLEQGELIKEIVMRAAMQSKLANDKPGTIPADIELFLDRLVNPKLPWNRLLQKYLQKFSKTDYSFKKPNRRFFPKHYLPSLHGESIIDLAIAVDISGSVSDKDFNRFVSEISSIMKMMKPEVIQLIQFDTEIKSIDKVRNLSDLMNVQFCGRGGTDILPVVQWANKHKPQALLVFTDGEFDFYKEETKVDTLWLIHNNPSFQAPYGKVIHYEIS